VKKSLTIAAVGVIIAVAAYIVFSQYELVKRKPRESAGKPKPGISETKESAALKKREEIYRRAAEKDKSAVAQLLTQLKDDSPMVRLAAARAILQLGGDEHIPTLVSLFKDPDKSVRAAVIQILGERRDPRIVPNLGEALKSDQELSVRLVALDAMRKIGDESCVPALIEALKDSQIVIRSQAQDALKAITFQKFEFDAKVLKDSPEQVYAKWNDWWEEKQVKENFSFVGVGKLRERNNGAAARILARIAHTSATGVEAANVKATAVASLCRMNCPEAAESFKAILTNHTDESLCLAAINAVVANKRKEFLPDVQRMSKNSKSEVIRVKSSWAVAELSK
jgi:HEAT repeat protein